MAQWVQTSGPTGGAVTSLAAVDGGMLAVINHGLYRQSGGLWQEVQSPWYGHLVSNGNVVLSVNSSLAKRSSDNGVTWEDASMPSTYVFTVGSTFYSLANDSIFSSADGSVWTHRGNTPNFSNSLIPHNGEFFSVAGWRELMRSTDQGLTWDTVSSELPFSVPSGSASTATSLFVVGYPGDIFQSTDNGNTWTDVTYNLKEQIQPLKMVAFKNSVIISDWTRSFILRGTTWEELPVAKINNAYELNGSLLMATEAGLFSFDGDRVSSRNDGLMLSPVTTFGAINNTLFARTNGGLYRSRDRGANWEYLSPMFAEDIVSVNGSVVIRGANIVRSTDEGDTWQNLDDVLEEFIVAPTDLLEHDGIIYLTSGLISSGEHGSGAGWTTGGVYSSSDGGASWKEISGNLPRNLWTTVPVHSITAKGSTLLLQTAAGLYVSDASNVNWIRAQSASVPEWGLIAATSEHFYSVTDSVWYVSQDGRSWAPLSASAPADFLRNVEFVQSTSVIRDELYITTRRTLRPTDSTYAFTSRHFVLRNNEWKENSQDLPAETITMKLFEHNDWLYSATSTRGVWRMDLPASSVDEAPVASSMQVYPNPSSTYVQVTGEGRTTIMTALGADVTGSIPAESVTAGVRFDIRELPAGVYFVRIGNSVSSFVKQ